MNINTLQSKVALSLAILTSVLGLGISTVLAADGSGASVVTPTTATASSTGNTHAFTFSATETMDSGELSMTVPASWTTPQGTAGTAGYTTVSTTGMIGNVINALNATTNWTATQHVAYTSDTVDKQEGTGSLVFSIPVSAAAGDQFYKNVTAQNWGGINSASSMARVGFFIKSNVATTAGQLQWQHDNNTGLASPIDTVNIPALAANTWLYTSMITTAGTTLPTITSYGLKYATDIGAATVKMDAMGPIFDPAGGNNWVGDTGITVSIQTSGQMEGTNNIRCTYANNAGVGANGDCYQSNSTAITQGPGTTVAFWARPSVALNAGDFAWVDDGNTALASPEDQVSLPALPANVWTFVTLTVPNSSNKATQSYGIRQLVDKGAMTFDVDSFMKIVDTGDTTTGWASTPVQSLSVDTTTYHEGGASLRDDIYAGAVAGDRWYETFGSTQDWSAKTTVGFWIRSSVATSAGNLQFQYATSSDLTSPVGSINIPALSANTWTYEKLTLSGTRTAIKTYGINYATDIGAATVWLDDMLIGPGTPTFPGGGAVDVRLLSLASGQAVTMTYGSGGGTSGATAPATTGAYTFTTTDRVSDSGTLAGIATSPVVTVNPAASSPTVTNITSSLANGTYKSGQVIPVTVTFNQSVLVTGTPQLTLSTGSPATTLVNYASGSGTNTLTFNYTVAAGNTSADLDYASISALILNGGTIKDSTGTINATLTLPSPGAAGSLGGNKNIVIDTTAPTLATVTPVPTPGHNTTPSYTLSSTEAGTITYGGSCASATTSATSGNNTITFSALTAGTYSNCTITVTDAAGNISSVLSVPTFVIDTTAPTLAVVTPVPTPTSSTTPIVTFSTTEAGTITYGGSCSSATTSATSGNNTITYSTLAAGTYSDCTITVTDAAGNISSVLNIPTFVIDTTAPVLASVTPVPTPGHNTTPSYTFSSTEAGTIIYGGSCSSATTSTSAGNNTITFNALAAGTYSTCTIRVKDAAGNTSAILTIPTFVIDTTAPTLAIVTPVSTPASSTTPIVTFSTTEAGTITYGGSCSSATTSATSGNNTITYSTLAAGTYSDCTITVTDAAGNISSVLSIPTFVIDTTAPTLATVTPVSTPGHNTTPSYTFSSTEAGTITYGGSCSSTSTSATAGNNTVTFAALVAGTYTDCTITVTDAAGNTSSVLHVPSFTIDTTAPILAVVTPVTTPGNDTTPDFTFSTTEAGTITYGGSCSSATTSATSGNNTMTFNALAAGTYSNCTITVTDAAGNISSVLSVPTFVIDTTAPVLATVTLVSTPTKNTTPSYTFSSTEAGTITYGGSCSSATTSATSGNNTVTFDALIAGTYSTCTITVTDAAGNVSSLLHVPTFVIDTTAPTLAVITPVPTPGKDTTPSFTFSSTEAGTITYGGSCSSAATSTTSGNKTVTFSTLAAGTYSDCTITVTDAAGNISSALSVPTFVIDTTAPVLAVVTPVPTPTNDTTPSFTFSSTEAGTITYGGSCSSATTSATSGNTTVTFATLADGTYTDCTVKVTDVAGNASSVLNVPSFTVDTTAPTVTNVTSPLANGTYKAGQIIPVTITFSEIVNVTGTPTLALATGSPASTAVTYTSGSGTNTLTFTYTVAAGNTSADLDYTSGASFVLAGGTIKSIAGNNAALTLPTPGAASSLGANKNIVIDTTTPTLTVVTPVVTPGHDVTPSFTFHANEAGTITYGGSCTSLTSSAISGNTTVTFATLAEGTYADCTITVTDAAGNMSDVLPIPSFTIDTTAPTLAVVTPVPTPGKNTTPSFTFSSTEAGMITYGGSCSSATASATSGNNTVTFDVLTSGMYSDCTITVTDTAGNTSAVLNVPTFVIDTVAPTLAVVTPVPTPGHNTTPSFTFSSTEAGTITYGGSCSASTTSATSGNNSVTFDALVAGTYSNCTITVTDTAGNTSAVLNVPTFVIDTVAPTLAVVTPVPTPGKDTTPNFTFSSTEAGTITYGGSCASADTSAIAGNNTETFSTLAAGTYSDCTVTVTDASGNISSVLNVPTFVIDTTAPVLAVVTPVPTPGHDTTPSFTFSSTEAGSITYGGSCSSATGSATSGNNTVTLNSLADGTYTNCTITVTDAAGNISSILHIPSFTIDTSAPVLAVVTPVPTPSNSTTPVFTFSSTKAGTITYGGSCESATTSATAGNNTISFNALTPATYTDCTITVTDAIGNVSAVLAIPSFTIFNPAPPAVKFVIFHPSDATAGGSITVTIQAQTTTSSIATIFNGGVTIVLGGSASVVGGDALVTLTDGVGTVDITDHAAETVPLSLTDSQGTGLDVSSTETAHFNAGSIHHLVIGTIANQIAGIPFDVTVAAKDQFGNTVTTFTGTADLSSSLGSVSPSITSAFVNGAATATISLAQSGTGITLTATKTGGVESGLSNAFDVSAGATKAYSLNDPGDMTAGTRIAYTVTRSDAHGNLVESGPETVYLFTSSAGGTAAFYDAATNGNVITSVTIPSGQHSATFWYYDDNEGGWTISASDNASAPDGATGVTGATDQINVSAAPIVATRLSIQVQASATVGDTVPVTIRAENGSGQLDTTYTRSDNSIVLHSTGSATASGGITVQLVNGVGTVNISDTVAQGVTLSIDDTTNVLTDTATAPVTFDAGVYDHFVFDTIGTQVAGVAFPIKITAKDQYGNTAVSFTGTTDMTTTAGTIAPAITGAFTAGVRTETVTVTTADTGRTITVTRTGGAEYGTSNLFDVTAGTTARYLLNDPGDMTAGTRIGYVVTRKDTNGNLVTSGTETAHLSSDSTGGKFYSAATGGTQVSTVTFVNGSATANVWYTDTHIGSWVVTVSDNITPDGDAGIKDASDSVNVSAAPIVATQFIILGDATAEAGNTIQLMIKAVDANLDVQTSFEQDVTVQLSGTGTVVPGSADHKLVNIVHGVGTVQVTSASAGTVTASLADTQTTGLDVSATKDLTFTPVVVPVVTVPSSGGGESGGGGLPSTTAAPIPTPTPVVEVKPDTVTFAGQAFPVGVTNVFAVSDGQVPLKQGLIKLSNGKFTVDVKSGLTDTQQYGIIVYDKNGRPSQAKIFTINQLTDILKVQDLLISPTIDVMRDILAKGDFLGVIGYAAPGNMLEFEVDGKIINQTTAISANGQYKLLINTNEYAFGKHVVRVRQVTSKGLRSDFSITKAFELVNYIITSADLNKDGQIDVRDLSIFNALWYNPKSPERMKIDLNGDGKVDIQDFSIFTRTLQKVHP